MMKIRLRTLFATLVALFTIISVSAAESVSFKVSAPMITSMGETFPVRFELNAKPDKDTFAPPSFDDFDVLAGPSVSQGSSVSIINGSMTKTVSYVITYILMPQKTGTFTIGSASIVVNGKSYSTQPTAVEVHSGASQQNIDSPQSNQHSGSVNDSQSAAESNVGKSIDRDDLFLRMDVSSRSVYKGESIRAILKLYSRVNIAGSEGSKMPTFNGFWSQQVDIQQGPFRETLNGKVYEAYNIAEYLLYPQQDGTLVIEPAELTVVAQIMVQSNRGYDPFFGGGHEVYNVRRELKTQQIAIDVKSLPEGAPDSFNGAVGRYTMTHNLSADKVVANSALTLQLKISGTGNLKFISAPKLELPNTFELYEVKSEERIQNKASGSSGYCQFEYPFIVRAEGNYDIGPVEFSYFDVDKNEYVTLATPPMSIEVTPDTSASSSSQPVVTGVKREDVRLLGQDIRFIKLGNPALRSVVTPLVLSPTYWLIIGLLLVVAVVAYLAIGKHIRDNSNVVLVKGKRANKMAVKRFRIAEKYMREHDRRAFYEEMLRALWGYLSDKFNIPVADLTREVVIEELSRRGAMVEAENIIAVIARCEEAQYSPAASAEMNNIYDEGLEAISKIESAIKR